MRNKTPSSNGRSVGWPSTLGLVLLALVLAIQAGPAQAANRRFLVILANPPKTFPDTGGVPEGGFANPALVNAQYFDINPNNEIYSFAEWWEEISYGSVTVTGETIGWVNLPWPIDPPPDPDGEDEDATISPDNHVNLDFDGHYAYGVGEPFAEDPMPVVEHCQDGICSGVPVDYNGAGAYLGTPLDAYPARGLPQDPDECRCCTVGDDPQCDEYDGYDAEGIGYCDDEGEPPEERENIPCGEGTCCLPEKCQNLCNWNPNDCITRDECIEEGGVPILPGSGTVCVRPCTEKACYEYRKNELGIQTRGPNIPSLPLVDGVYTPGERFRDVDPPDGRYSALFEPPTMIDSSTECGTDFLESDFQGYVDIDDSGSFNIPEPFEDYLVRWDPTARNGAGDWVLVSDEYIRANYPYNPDWNVKDQIDFWLTQPEFGGYTNCDVTDPKNTDAPGCLYLKQEMFQLRGLGGFGASGFELNDGAIAAWTNVDEMAWRSGNGVYDPPERFRDDWGDEAEDDATVSPLSTKMQHLPDDGDLWTTATPPPGSGPGVDTVAWYEDFWRTRYGTDPPDWAKGNSGRNSPRMVAFDPQNPNPSFDGDTNTDEFQRRLDADAGRPDSDPAAPEEQLGGPTEPDEHIGFYDGWVEHDDLASSKYHPFGDQRLGEVTSPFSGHDDEENMGGIAGDDQGIHRPDAAAGPDHVTPAAGPLATDVHGNNRLDGGNVLMLEWMTWRTDINPTLDDTAGGWARGEAWDHDGGLLDDGRWPHPYAGPASGLGPDGQGVGFRDFNLDGLIDQGEVRPAGSENYKVDSVFGTSDDGTFSKYPFNRRRLLEDCIAIIDDAVDFDLWHDVNSPYYGGPQPTNAAGIVSEIVLLPAEAIQEGQHNDTFPMSPSLYPVHTDDRAPETKAALFRGSGQPSESSLWIADPSVPNAYYSNLWFHDLVAGLDRGAVSGGAGGAGGSGGVLYQMRYAAHEYGHAWEGYPDLYDYRRLTNAPAETFPIGLWCVMADGDVRSGYPVHPVGDLKSRKSGWIDAVDLTTVLSPGVEQEVTFADWETNNNSTLYVYNNPLSYSAAHQWHGERFYLWRAGFLGAGQFDRNMPGQGVLILHTDLGTNPDAVPPQQQLNPYAWYIVQADGDYDLDSPAQPNEDGDLVANAGDDGDPWPGFKGDDPLGGGGGPPRARPPTARPAQPRRGDPLVVGRHDDPLDPPTHPFGNYQWYYSTVPNNRWHGGGFSGIDIVDIIETPSATRITFRWTPTEVPVLVFDRPPAEMSGELARVSFWTYDQYAGTTIELYYEDDDEGYAGTLIGTTGKDTSGILEPGSVDWNVAPLPDGLYYLYAKLIPGPGQDGTENEYSTVRASRNNLGDGTLAILGVGDTVKLEGWTVTYEFEEEDNPNSPRSWKVVGSLSEAQARAQTGQLYTTDGGEVTFRITEGSEPFFIEDQFVFVTTGLTQYEGPVNIVGGRVKNGPIARICDQCVSPLAGDPPLTVQFDGRASSPAPGSSGLDYHWTFGEGEGEADGDQVTHTYERPGIFAVTLRVTDQDPPHAFDTTEVEIRVNNGKPIARIVAVALTPENEFPLTMQFFGDESSDPEELPLSYFWEFTGPLPEHNKTSELMNPPVQTYFEDPAHPGEPYTEDVVVRLLVTDSAGETDVDDYSFRPGNSMPVPRIRVNRTSGEVPFKVEVDGSESYDPDESQTLTYHWDFGDQGDADTADTAKATYTYEKPGTYTITLTVSDGINQDDAWIRVVARDPADVPQKPIAKFSAEPTSGYPPLTVDFDATESYDPQAEEMDYSWTFGDGAQGGGKMVSHTYTEPDKYTVTLKVVDPDGYWDDTSVKIDVLDPDAPGANLPPLASFNANPTEGPAPLTVRFESTSTDPDGDPLTQNWDFGDAGDGDTASGTSVSYTYRSPGTYEVTLRVGDAEGLVGEAKETIRVTEGVNNPPEARVATHPSIIIAPAQVTFDATLSSDPDQDELTFTWEISSGGTPLGFADDLVGALLTVSFQNTVAECNAVAGPCLTPGSYTLVLTADDGQGGTANKETSFEVRGGSGGPILDPGEPPPGAEVPQDRALTGSARFTSAGPCGIGVLTPMLLLGLTLSAWMVRRRRH